MILQYGTYSVVPYWGLLLTAVTSNLDRLFEEALRRRSLYAKHSGSNPSPVSCSYLISESPIAGTFPDNLLIRRVAKLLTSSSHPRRETSLPTRTAYNHHLCNPYAHAGSLADDAAFDVC